MDLNTPFKNLKLPETEHKPSLPAPKVTPAPQVNKVTNGTVIRTPINRQTALLLSPIRCWTAQPLPDKPKVADPKEVERLRAELKTERNDHAQTRDDLGNARAQIRALKEALALQSETVVQLQEINRRQAETIRQLEDLKL